jgi:formamidopyrimidine-DNA glycosylase
MPELPEVETIVRGLQSKILPNDQIKNFKWYDNKPFGTADPKEISKLIKNKCISKIKRYGKYILFHLSDNASIVTHLRMTGKFVFTQTNDKQESNKHLRYEFIFENATSLQFMDVRRFGTFRYYDSSSELTEIVKLGLDALNELSFSDDLYQKFKLTKQVLKSFLLDQSKIAGLGNIYACEALFLAKLSPNRIVSSLSRKEFESLISAVNTILLKAIEHNGTSISDYRQVDDKSGSFQNFLKVYGKEDSTCLECGHTIVRENIGGRSTFYCQKCQK